MSDYLFTSQQNKCSELTESIKQIYQGYEKHCQEFEGEWGSLSVSPSPYKGLQPLETETHICIILGGPVFYFRDNSFLTGDKPTEGTQSLFERYFAGELDLENDISGPFQFVIVNKTDKTVRCITDLMLFIPAYVNKGKNSVTFGSHVDAVARVIRTNKENIDKVSVADFILHGIVTFPHTVYDTVKQLHPATSYEYAVKEGQIDESISKPYWLPYEKCEFESVQEAAKALREGVCKHIHAITDSMTEVAQFISGGEDSRSLSGLLPAQLKRDAFIFLDSMNREGRIAEKVAKAYGANFHMGKREALHYLDIIDDASTLAGSGYQYVHCHSLWFDKLFNLNNYSAVFGGYSSDVFLKGYFARKAEFSSRLGFIPEKWLREENRSHPVDSPMFEASVLAEITKRRRDHLDRVDSFRPESSHEWFQVWPATMRSAIPNHFCNRRLFSSYEVFMSHEVLKVSASVPTDWKLNRKLFHSAFQSCLRKSKWIRHGDGRLPYFKAWANIPMQFLGFVNRVLTKLKLIKKRNHGPWHSWEVVQASMSWVKLTESSIDYASRNGLIEKSDLLTASDSLSRNLNGLVHSVKKTLMVEQDK